MSINRLASLVIVSACVVLVAGCDRYVEQAALRPDGTVAFLAEADIICSDPLQNAVFDRDPCEIINDLADGETTADLPFEFNLDNAVEFEVSGALDRRTLLARWQGPRAEFRSVLVSGLTITELDGERTQATFTTDGAPAATFAQSTEPGILAALPTSRWAVGEFRAIAPAVVVEHNGDRVDGRTVIWEFDDDVPETLNLTWSTEERSFRLWWWAIGAAILGAVLIMIVVFEGRKDEPEETADHG